MAKVTGEMLVPGQRVWKMAYSSLLGDVMVELIIIDGVVDTVHNKTRVAYANPKDAQYHAASLDYVNGQYYIYLGDLGVRPYNYDERASQLFTTKKALEVAALAWDGKNPNFLPDALFVFDN